jgi:hypothetical protein
MVPLGLVVMRGLALCEAAADEEALDEFYSGTSTTQELSEIARMGRSRSLVGFMVLMFVVLV